jgi:hypothetical protein
MPAGGALQITAVFDGIPLEWRIRIVPNGLSSNRHCPFIRSSNLPRIHHTTLGFRRPVSFPLRGLTASLWMLAGSCGTRRKQGAVVEASCIRRQSHWLCVVEDVTCSTLTLRQAPLQGESANVIHFSNLYLCTLPKRSFTPGTLQSAACEGSYEATEAERTLC